MSGILWNQTVHYRVNNSPPISLSLSQIHPVQFHPTPSLKHTLILYSHLHLVFKAASCIQDKQPKSVFPPPFPTHVTFIFNRSIDILTKLVFPVWERPVPVLRLELLTIKIPVVIIRGVVNKFPD